MHDIWNPWHGCHKISPGCQNCYMYCLDQMRDLDIEKSNTVYKTNGFNDPLKKDRQKNYKIKPGERVRVNMTSDTFVEEADEWRDEMWEIIKKRSDVIFWLLTKRPERILEHLPTDWGEGYENVFMNVTCENQDMFDKRWPIFAQIPAKHKGLCLAPLLSDIDITPALKSQQIEEISVGGENYDNPRPCDYDWVKHISDQCYDAKINFHWYETGTNLIRDGFSYRIPNKHYQAVLAGLAHLNQIWYEIDFKLYDENGNLIPKEDYYVRQFNTKSCTNCGNQNMCNGCSQCGKCGKNLTMVSLSELQKLQNDDLLRK